MPVATVPDRFSIVFEIGFYRVETAHNRTPLVLDGGSRAGVLDASPYHLNRQEQWPLRGLIVDVWSSLLLYYKHGL